MTNPRALELALTIHAKLTKGEAFYGPNEMAADIEASLAERDAEIERMVSNIKEAMCFSMAEEARVCLENALSTNGKDNNNGMA